jgi:arylsulfatase
LQRHPVNANLKEEKMSRMTRWLRFALAALGASLLLAPALSYAQKKPNILVIFGDDVGQTNISVYGLGVVVAQARDSSRSSRYRLESLNVQR